MTSYFFRKCLSDKRLCQSTGDTRPTTLRSGASGELDYVGLRRAYSGEVHALRLERGMFLTQMAVHFHCERASVFMPEPPRDRWNVNAGFDAR